MEGVTPTPRPDPAVLRAGDEVLLIDAKARRYLLTLSAGDEFHSHRGVVAHDQLIGSSEGVAVRASQGGWFRVLRPTLADFVLKMPRGAQVIYPKDLGPLLILADIFPPITSSNLHTYRQSCAASFCFFRNAIDSIATWRPVAFFCAADSRERYDTRGNSK